MKLRKATQHDLKGILNVFEQAIRQTCTADYTPLQIEVWAMAAEKTTKWQNRIKTQHFLIAELDMLIVGFASLEGKDYFDLIYVHPDYLGQGIARKLYLTLEQKSKSLGSTLLLSDVSITARPFFERQGFKVLHRNQNLIGDVEITNFRMRKTF